MRHPMTFALALALGLALAGTGLHMLFDPAGWYGLVPGVSDTGPLNPHFVRDIGCAYLMAGAAFVWLAFDDRARPAALVGAVFLALHALVHVVDAMAGRSHAEHAITTIAAVFVPAVIALWLALPAIPISKGASVLTSLIRRRIDAFERSYGYDTSYMRDILAADGTAFMAFAKLENLTRYRKDVPLPAWYAAKIAGTLDEDCGPCTQLVTTMAERDGVSADVLKALATGDVGAMPDDVVLAYRFAQASLAHDPAADELRDEITKRWGPRALVSLAFALATARIYPTVKYALGHGQMCSRLMVGGDAVPVLKQAA